MDVYVAGVECGGTSFVISVAKVVGSSSSSSSCPSLEVVCKKRVVTKDNPEETLEECADWLSSQCYNYQGLGIASFGPVGLNPHDLETYGRILPSSPKQHWRNVDILTPLLTAVTRTNNNNSKKKIPHKIDTDVNAPAYAEYLMSKDDSSSSSISSVAYITVGTGVGVGLVMNGQPVHGLMHPEGGHVHVKPLANDDFPGYSWGKDKSPYNGQHTVEGIASSVALVERLLLLTTDVMTTKNREVLADLPDSHDIWDHAANALANLCVSLILLTSVEKITLGGGIMNRSCLYDKIRHYTHQHLNQYIPTLPPIGPSQFQSEAGMMGALLLAHQAYLQQQQDDDDDNDDDDTKQQPPPPCSTNHTFLHGFLHGAAAASIVILLLLRSKKSL